MVGNALEDDIESIIHDLDKLEFLDHSFLVTGGAGFLGSWVCESLITLGGRVTCLDNMATGLLENVKTLVGNPAFDLLDRDVTLKIPGEFDYVLHMASRASPEEYQLHPVETLLANAQGSLNAIKVAHRSGSKILFTSTSEVYGDAEIIPTPENYKGNVSPNGIRSCYD